MEAAAAHSMKQPAQHLQNLRDLLQQKKYEKLSDGFSFSKKIGKVSQGTCF